MSEKRPRQVTIGLVWHSLNSDNLGVGALTIANIALLKRAAEVAGVDPRFVVIGWKDPRPFYAGTDELGAIEMVPIRTRHMIAPRGPLVGALRQCDLVCDIGGGDSFTDIYGAKRFLVVWGVKAWAHLMGRTVVLSPQTVGPFDRGWTRRLAVWAMNRARLVVTRDRPSTEFLHDLGVASEIFEATDVAMGLPYTPPERDPVGPVRIGLNVSGLMFNGGYTRSNQFGLKSDYAALIRELISRLTARAGTEVHLVGHVQSDHVVVEDDQRVNIALTEEFPDLVLAPVFRSPSEAKSYIAGLDFFIGARMHATIAALSSGVPMVATAYSRKFKGVFGTLGYPHVTDCREDTAEEIIAAIEAQLDQRNAAKEEIERAMSQVDVRLDGYVERVAAILRDT